MIINPIIPIWLMSIICIILIVLIIHNKKLKNIIKPNTEKTPRHKKLIRDYVINIVLKISIVILLFLINLRFMLPNGESMAINSDLSVLFVIDTSVSMRALDYDGEKERVEGVINDSCYIVDELSGCKFSIITFSDKAQRLIPFTTDSDMVQSELKAISLENDYYAKGSSLNSVKDVLEKTLKDEYTRQEGKTKFIVFFITDGEITKEGENLKSFSSIGKYVSNGAVLGYGTTNGGKMINSLYKDDPSSEFYYIYYYGDGYDKITAISKLDEQNLKNIANDLKVDYVQMSKTANIDYKLNDIKKQIYKEQTSEQKINSYQDIYYYFAIPLIILFAINVLIIERRLK